MSKNTLFLSLALTGFITVVFFLATNGNSPGPEANTDAEGAQIKDLELPPEAPIGFSGASQQLESLGAMFEESQRINRKQFQRLQNGYDRAIKILTELEDRLQYLERTNVDNAGGADQEADSPVPESGHQPAPVSDAEMAHWLDQSIIIDKAGVGPEMRIKDVAQRSIRKLPDVNLDDLKCGDGFCRATFSHAAGEKPEVNKLFGEPPFLNEGFTINQPDGRVLLYFNQPGESIEELRMNAQVWAH